MLKTDKNTYAKYGDVAYLVILSAFIIHTYFDNTTFSLPWPSYYYEVLRIVMAGVVLMRFALKEADDIKRVILYFVFWMVLALAAEKTGYVFLIEIALLALGASNISFDVIARLYLYISAFILSSAILASGLGVIPNYVYYSRGIAKNSFGIIYSTDFGAHVLFTVLVYIYLRAKKMTYIECVYIGMIGLFIYKYCHARMNAGTLIILACFAAIFIFVNEKSRRLKWLRYFKKSIKGLMVFSFLICSSISFFLVRYFDASSPFFVKLNTWLTGRLDLGRQALERYGVTLFGTPFDLVGTDYVSTGAVYNFVDCSYILIALRYGLLILLLLCVFFTLTSYRALKTADYWLLIALSVISFHGLIEHHFFEMNYNIFLLVPFASFERKYERSLSPKEKKGKLVGMIPGVIAISFYLARDHIISFFRTAWMVLGYAQDQKQVLFLTFMLGLFLICYIMWRMIRSKHMKACVLLGAVYSVSIVCVSSLVLYRGYEQNKSTIVKTVDILKSIDHIEIPIYADVFSFYYRLNGIKVLPGIAIVQTGKTNISLIRSEQEYNLLIKEGYKCGQINEKEYIYTNGEEMIDRLEQEGLTIQPFHDHKHIVDLKKLAGYNKLIFEDGSLILNGSKQSLYCGPNETVYRGQLKVIFDIDLIKAAEDTDEIAMISATYNYGASEIARYDLRKDAFQNGSNILIELENAVPNMVDLEFKIYVRDGVELKVNGIQYFKIG
ncbi:MAG: hypothetical protein HFG22_00445 [Lachnospiraceae bacterium]|nr:hypothetical protein [Lachnospiraceae bacterium]